MLEGKSLIYLGIAEGGGTSYDTRTNRTIALIKILIYCRKINCYKRVQPAFGRTTSLILPATHSQKSLPSPTERAASLHFTGGLSTENKLLAERAKEKGTNDGFNQIMKMSFKKKNSKPQEEEPSSQLSGNCSKEHG